MGTRVLATRATMIVTTIEKKSHMEMDTQLFHRFKNRGLE